MCGYDWHKMTFVPCLLGASSYLLDIAIENESQVSHPFDAEVAVHRKPDFEINSLILDRWSPRAMTGEELSERELMTLKPRGGHHPLLTTSHGDSFMQR